MATKSQISKILAAVKNITISGNGAKWEVETETEAGKRNVCRVLRAAGVSVGGYKCGHGGWVLRPDFNENNDDFNSKSSRHHY